jgi:hypothetical protein
MITVPGSYKEVFEITATEIKIPDKQDIPSLITGQKPIKKWTAPSTSIIVVHNRSNEIELTVGRAITPDVVKNCIRYLIKNQKIVVISKCEVINSLREIDRMVVLCNDILKNQQSLLEELPPEIESDNDYPI